jgi:hypothetical protein
MYAPMGTSYSGEREAKRLAREEGRRLEKAGNLVGAPDGWLCMYVGRSEAF